MPNGDVASAPGGLRGALTYGHVDNPPELEQLDEASEPEVVI